MLSIYNSLSRHKEEFVPIEPGKVRMYVCGMTVYDFCHLGHARTVVGFDVVQRWLRTLGYAVTYVRNITDIDDKIIRRAGENGESIFALTTRMIAAMNEDFAALGIQRPDLEPRATDYVIQMQELIAALQEKGLAYQAEDGDVNFAVRKFDGYGKLSGKSIDELRAGERVAVDTAKRDPLDFVLWKSAKESEPAESKWASPWGNGRPGWHIECSAMSGALLGKTLDIHGGGPDLPFPHHENEIAQSEGAHNCCFSRFWMHTGALNVGEEKMSKSLGNFFTIRDALQHYDGEVLRFFILRSHYRSQIHYVASILEDAKQSLARLYTALRDVPAAADFVLDWNEPRATRFRAAMNDDFNTAEAVAVLFELANAAQRERSAHSAALLRALAQVLGLLEREPSAYLQGRAVGDHDLAQIEALIAERNEAKRNKDFARADAVRARLTQLGVVLEDTAQGTSWRRA